MEPETSYLLLTPGPLSTSRTVRQAMSVDYSTWDVDYNSIVQSVRQRSVELAVKPSERARFTSVLMQGSGTFAVEATLGTVLPQDGKLLILSNGAYGARMTQIAERLKIAHVELRHDETAAIEVSRVRSALESDPQISHVAMVHCETTTGILNDFAAVGRLVAEFGKPLILDAMSSLGGIPIDMANDGVQFLISSANKCVQGVPGFGLVIAEQERLAATAGQARSLSLDLYDQWREMENKGGKWRYTSPTHVVLAFSQALDELAEEGGVEARNARYSENQRKLVAGMDKMGFRTLLPAALHSPIITSFHCPVDPLFSFQRFYDELKSRRFVIYPGKVTDADTFRIGTIGHVFADDIDRLLASIDSVKSQMGFHA